MHEILTVQLGTQANYVGTHFWNTQEKYFTYANEEISLVDHDIHFRAGRAPNGSETYNPRALIYDLKENFGALKKAEGEYVEEFDTSGGIWPNSSTIHTGPPISTHPYIDSLSHPHGPLPSLLCGQPPRYFTDLSHTYFHPRSIMPLPRAVIPTVSHLNPLKSFRAGAEFYHDLDIADPAGDGDLFERDVRWWVEECDNLQGVQIITGADDAWGGFAGAWVERWKDEMGGGKGVWVWGVEKYIEPKEQSRESRLLSLLNETLALCALAMHASLYVPLTSQPLRSPSYLTYDPGSAWHVSALQATALETAAFSSRLRPASNTRRGMFQDMEEITNSGGNRNVAKLEMSIQDAESDQIIMTGDKSDYRMANGHMIAADEYEEPKKLDVDMFSKDMGNIGNTHSSASQSEHVFGRVEVVRGNWGLGEERTEGEERWSGPVVERYHSPLTYPQLTSFPTIFGVQSDHRLAIHTALTTSSAVATQIRQMERTVRRYVSVDEREAVSDGLKTLCEEYEEGWDSGSDEGEDE
ncbi:tubulin nucleotide-binding domain-like protein [Pseudovirgaria hyperparasitica]|uniref:Tubulin nucleotide-binding domain-like protein n=1 Tax=Pseudovirgaria hyperparasitica TaxID=470096 RepID=A0A6A6W621_9PEZI|nr:tubulin nucleotide-binding domain-like protein [Pseudovirgaria hyperparasitica]KAF2756997.1 tubulin nucleotide-binding domain-like protein [Pseudovirgaria hyperparasitica]